MKNNMFLIAALTLMPIAQASSQEVAQTKSSAMKFIDMTLPGSKYNSSSNANRNFADITRTAQNNNSDCRYTYMANYHYQDIDRNRYYSAESINSQINFKYIAEVKHEGTDITLYFSDHPGYKIYRFSSNQLAARVAYAIEFLRQQCDVTAETGF